MDTLISWTIFAVFISAGVASDSGLEGLEVYLKNKTAKYFLEVGSEATFVCHVNQPLTFMMEHDVDWHIKQDWFGGKNYYLVDKIKLQDDADPDFYAAGYKLVDDAKALDFTFTIKSVRPQDDGKLVCESDGVKSELEIVVIEPLNSLSLKLNDNPAITIDTTVPMLLDYAEHTIVCEAKGSNPATKDVQITLGGEKIEAGDPVIEQEEGELRKFTTTVTATILMKYDPHHGKEIQCVAKDTRGTVMSVKMPVQIKTPQPNITCTPMKTYTGKRMVTLTCTVDHKDIVIDGFSYVIQLGSKPYKVNKDKSQKINGKMVKVKEEKKGSDKTTVVLQLEEVQNEHFAGNIELVVESSGGHLSEEKVMLTKIKGPSNVTKKGPNSGSPMMAVSLATVLLTSLLACVL